ncbi:MAG: 4-hydroxy-3-methylbut-2-enyl diphosphate reductase [SAR202 cluster bacterium]|nr:4-hydroxy-3-methylbut-2-enyl diphosphate reductase [SAR202 cluster bacterium]MQG68323.1 4-hydroxy-3-methylbut-2-enyl diphosphate reductase [SAR202 cluster bacterium]|tara:strand:- start:7610 stop:8599 length:990 start_codon:yes stop_codon:yes gene_type:complete
MKVYLGKPRGFCAGVVRAVDVVELALQRYPHPVYVKHQIVHNPYVVKSLEDKGAITVDDVENIPAGSTVVFSAHGSPPEDFERAAERGLNVVDATCPLVTKVHNEARKYARDGRKLVLVGHRGHQEVIGTMGQSEMDLLDNREGSTGPDWPDDTPVTVLTQTTLSVDDTQRAIERVKDRFEDVIVRNDLCYATTNRQATVKQLSGMVELVLVIGAPNSSNCNRLREVAEAYGVDAHLINGPDELDPSWLEGVENVGITSGASTPESLVRAVIEALGTTEVVTIEGAEEDVSFVLPPELRDVDRLEHDQDRVVAGDVTQSVARIPTANDN